MRVRSIVETFTIVIGVTVMTEVAITCAMMIMTRGTTGEMTEGMTGEMEEGMIGEMTEGMTEGVIGERATVTISITAMTVAGKVVKTGVRKGKLGEKGATGDPKARLKLLLST